jgi:hypothetical protein
MKIFQVLATLCLCFSAAALTAQTPATHDPAQPPTASAQFFTKDMTVYVSDFDLDAQNVQTDQGSAIGQRRPGIFERPQKKEQQDPQAQATKLVNTLSTSIVSDLEKAGYKAQRLASTDPKPTTGAWVHGVFTQVDEGSRLQRAVIGFGAGNVSMDLYVTLSNLANPQQPLYQSAESGTSADKPGAVITMNPYVAAAKFVMEKNAPEKTVKNTAAQISKQIEQHLQEHAAATM